MTGSLKLTPETEAKIKVLLYPKPTFTKRQELLLKQAQNCRDLAHFLRTDPRVKGHYSGYYRFRGIDNWTDKEEILECNTTACAGGWAYIAGIIPEPWDSKDDEYFGVGKPLSPVYSHVFGARNRTPQEEAQVLEAHATKLEAQV